MYKSQIFLLFLLLTLPQATGGPICYASCLAALFGTAAILPALGFTSTGIAAGSWAATWMAAFGGAMPAGSLFDTLQPFGVAGASWSTIASYTGICAALCTDCP